ncbi:hypothetical protein [Serratia fonticola]|uniref:hypothetical protein n=1 Tax=Serratia fonticola TaxID=47917 RepID=UPI001C47D16A|nr:hypothetical protein [Serratia fonticola]QXN65241.1 hypothetical protein J8M99_26125 [Serratia fonticola]
MEEMIESFIKKHESNLQVIAFFVFPLTCVTFLSISASILHSGATGLVSSWVEWRICLLLSILINAIYLCVVFAKIQLSAVYMAIVGILLAMLIFSLGSWLVVMFINYEFTWPSTPAVEGIFACTIVLQMLVSFFIIKES